MPIKRTKQISGTARDPWRRRGPGAAKSSRDFLGPALGTLGRTRRLIMAALRVWELKQGSRD